MIIDDKRTQEQKDNHDFLVVGTDSFMSGWGCASKGSSYAAWGCSGDDLDDCMDRVKSRSEMKRVRYVGTDYRPNPAYCAHLSIYSFKG